MKLAIVLSLLVLLALQYRLWAGSGSIGDVQRLRAELAERRDVLERVTERNAALQAEVADLKSGLDAIEERARSELGMIDRDETFYRFVRDRGRAARAQTTDDARNGSASPTERLPPGDPASPERSP